MKKCILAGVMALVATVAGTPPPFSAAQASSAPSPQPTAIPKPNWDPTKPPSPRPVIPPDLPKPKPPEDPCKNLPTCRGGMPFPK